jgi:ATP-binding cassette subfamily C (CFTR/MRP) protein 1
VLRAAADHRLGIIRQVIADIKPIKLCSWEESFEEMIARARQIECRHMMNYRILFQGSTQIGRAIPFLAACPSFVYMALTEERLDAANIFAALSVFMSLRLALIMLPTSLALYAAMQVSLKRVEEYLDLPEHVDLPTPDSGPVLAKVGMASAVCFEWPGTPFQLQDVAIEIRTGELIGVIGVVGVSHFAVLNRLR